MSEENKEVPEEVIKGPGLYETFFKGEYDDTHLAEIFDFIHKLPTGSNLIIWTNSNGGSMHVGMMLKDKLEAKNLNVTFISHLFNGSMGVLMPQCGDFLRLTYPHAVFTFHAPTRRAQGNDITFNSMSAYVEVAINKIKQMTMDKVGLNKKDLNKFWGPDQFFYGYQLLDIGENGWVDGVILKELGTGVFLVKTRDGNKEIDVTKHKRNDLKDLPVVE